MSSGEAEVSWLRRGFAQPGGALHSDDCPTPETLWDAVRGALPPDEIRAVVEHLAVCAACAEEWRLALALVSGESESAPEVRTARGRRALLGLVAASLVAAALGGSLLLRHAAGPDVGRSEMRGAEEATRSPDDGATLPRSEFLLRWTPVPGALSSDIAVFTDANEVVAQREGIQEDRYRVPAASLRPFASGSTLYWTVTFNLPAGRQLDSPTFRTRLR